MRIKVLLKTPKDVSEVAFAAQNLPSAVEAVGNSGRYRVDARSIMGLFSLNLTKPIELNWNDVPEIHEKNRLNTFLDKLNRFVVDADEYEKAHVNCATA